MNHHDLTVAEVDTPVTSQEGSMEKALIAAELSHLQQTYCEIISLVNIRVWKTILLCLYKNTYKKRYNVYTLNTHRRVNMSYNIKLMEQVIGIIRRNIHVTRV